jgi:hypothetical protein
MLERKDYKTADHNIIPPQANKLAIPKTTRIRKVVWDHRVEFFSIVPPTL